MRHDPLVSIEDALRACRLILEFTVGMDIGKIARQRQLLKDVSKFWERGSQQG